MKITFPYYKQLDAMDCGPTALRMVAKYYGKTYSLQYLREILFVYSVNIFLIFIFSSILYVLWITFFLKRRKEIDYLAFQQMSDNQDSLIEIIQGMKKKKSSKRKRFL